MFEPSRPAMAWITVLRLILQQVMSCISINPMGQLRRRSGQPLQSQRGNH